MGLIIRVKVFELESTMAQINRWPAHTSAVLTSEIATLAHKIGNDSGTCGLPHYTPILFVIFHLCMEVVQ